jgi:hypothetical protein
MRADHPVGPRTAARRAIGATHEPQGGTMDRTIVTSLRHRLAEQTGEGVISTAIAVLIMAIIGGLMWVAFQGVFDSASGTISTEVEQIGN